MSWKHQSSKADESDPPKSAELDIVMAPARYVYIWPRPIPGDILSFRECASDVYDMALEAMMKPPDLP